jgi:hypothetical protein
VGVRGIRAAVGQEDLANMSENKGSARLRQNVIWARCMQAGYPEEEGGFSQRDG